MTSSSVQPYPRPDFERTSLRWTSLNGPWDFLFDDNDVGLTQKWQRGLPAEAASLLESASTHGSSSEGDAIIQQVASGTHDLIQDNKFAKSSGSGVNKKLQIKVPFVFQCPASGINDRSVHEVMWYERTINDERTAEEKKSGYRHLLRFGAVDYEATVWVNGHFVGSHRGGHVPFDLDVTDAMDVNELNTSYRVSIRVYDSAFDLTQPRGKQYWGAKPESIFYTPSGGIWQSVWLEVVPPVRIADSSRGTIIRSNDIHAGKLHCNIAVLERRVGQPCSVEVEASFAGLSVNKATAALPRDRNHTELVVDMRIPAEKRDTTQKHALQDSPVPGDSCWLDGVALWSPEHPLLYDITIRLTDPSGKILDEIKTITGMRSINWMQGDNIWRLNDRPYFQALCLDQGYWPDTFMTPPSQESLKADILLAKKMGLNGCRKHQKVEDPAFYYWADKLGYLVWGEMASAYQFSKEYAERFNQEWIEAVKLVVNRPSVVTWTPVNESWGYTSLKDNQAQRDHIRDLYYMTRVVDDTRSINDNCGWEHVCTDLTTFHDYADGPELEKTCADLNKILGPKANRDMFVPEIPGQDVGAKHNPGAPIMCTEFAGVNIAASGQSNDQNSGHDWGYTTATDSEDLLKRIDRLVKGVTGGGLCCAFVYTQLTDIEQETNGLYSFDRKEKLDSAKMKAIVEEGLSLFYKRVSAKS